MSHQHDFQHYRPINNIMATILSFTLKLQWWNWPKIWFGCNFWLGGPIDARSTRLKLNCILQDLSRDTPLDHIWRPHIRCQICRICSNMPNMLFGAHIWWSSCWFRARLALVCQSDQFNLVTDSFYSCSQLLTFQVVAQQLLTGGAKSAPLLFNQPICLVTQYSPEFF